MKRTVVLITLGVALGTVALLGVTGEAFDDGDSTFAVDNDDQAQYDLTVYEVSNDTVVEVDRVGAEPVAFEPTVHESGANVTRLIVTDAVSSQSVTVGPADTVAVTADEIGDRFAYIIRDHNKDVLGVGFVVCEDGEPTASVTIEGGTVRSGSLNCS